MIEEAQQLVDEAVRGTNMEGSYKAYERYGFDRLLGNGNPYNDGIHTLLENLK